MGLQRALSWSIENDIAIGRRKWYKMRSFNAFGARGAANTGCGRFSCRLHRPQLLSWLTLSLSLAPMRKDTLSLTRDLTSRPAAQPPCATELSHFSTSLSFSSCFSRFPASSYPTARSACPLRAMATPLSDLLVVCAIFELQAGQWLRLISHARGNDGLKAPDATVSPPTFLVVPRLSDRSARTRLLVLSSVSIRYCVCSQA